MDRVFQTSHQVGVVAPEPNGQDVALPELVGPGPLEEARLRWVLLRLDRGLFHQPPCGKRLVDRRRAGAHEEKALEKIADPPRAVLGMLRFNGYRLLPNLLRNAALLADGTLGLKPRRSVKPVRSHPALDRMGADPKLLDQKFGAVPFLQVKLYDPQPELHRKSQRPALPLRPGCGALGCSLHRATSSLCKETFAQLVCNFCALTPLIPTFLLFYIKITIRNLLIINVLYAMSCSSQLLHTRR